MVQAFSSIRSRQNRNHHVPSFARNSPRSTMFLFNSVISLLLLLPSLRIAWTWHAVLPHRCLGHHSKKRTGNRWSFFWRAKSEFLAGHPHWKSNCPLLFPIVASEASVAVTDSHTRTTHQAICYYECCWLETTWHFGAATKERSKFWYGFAFFFFTQIFWTLPPCALTSMEKRRVNTRDPPKQREELTIFSWMIRGSARSQKCVKSAKPACHTCHTVEPAVIVHCDGCDECDGWHSTPAQ